MKTLLIMRHAKSSWNEPRLPDHERPLNKRGKRDAPRMGELLKARDIVPDLIVPSTATRARMTADGVARGCDFEGPVEPSGQLYGHGAGGYWAVIRDLPEAYACVLTVGHNPDVEEMVARLCGEDIIMPTAALAQIVFSAALWEEVAVDRKGELVGYWAPKEL